MIVRGLGKCVSCLTEGVCAGQSHRLTEQLQTHGAATVLEGQARVSPPSSARHFNIGYDGGSLLGLVRVVLGEITFYSDCLNATTTPTNEARLYTFAIHLNVIAELESK